MFHVHHMAAALCVLGFAFGTAHADTLHFDFTATVTYASEEMPGVSAGTTFSGQFSYDPTGFDYQYGQGPYVSYVFGTGGQGQLSATVGANHLHANQLGVDVMDNLGSNVEDGVSITGYSPLTLNGVTYEQGYFGFNLTSKPGNTGVINGLDLPTSYDVSAFDGHESLTYGFMFLDGGYNTTLQFQVNSITAVPEPAKWMLLPAGLAMLGGAVRRSRR